MRKLIILFLILQALISCDSRNVRDGRNAYKEYLSKTLKDPSSLIIHDETFSLPQGSEGLEVVFTVDYGAKNSYGAMSRETIVFRTIGNSIFEINGKRHYDELNIDNDHSDASSYSTPKKFSKKDLDTILEIEKEIDKKNDSKYNFLGSWLVVKKFDTSSSQYNSLNNGNFRVVEDYILLQENNKFQISGINLPSISGDFLEKNKNYILNIDGNNIGYIIIINHSQDEAEIELKINSSIERYIIHKNK